MVKNSGTVLVTGATGYVGGRPMPLLPQNLLTGDALDFWRVIEIDSPGLLRLIGNVKPPGKAILKFELTSFNGRMTEIKQLSRFLPKGLFGLIYWYLFYPFHQILLIGMLSSIAKKAEAPIFKGLERFAPERYHVCALPSKK